MNSVLCSRPSSHHEYSESSPRICQMAVNRVSSCGPQPNSQPPPPIAQAPRPIGVISRSLFPSFRFCIMGSFLMSCCELWRVPKTVSCPREPHVLGHPGRFLLSLHSQLVNDIPGAAIGSDKLQDSLVLPIALYGSGESDALVINLRTDVCFTQNWVVVEG
jgi:hypothetical protein